MKKLLIVLIGLVFTSCVNVETEVVKTDAEESVSLQHPDFEKNKEIAQKFIRVFRRRKSSILESIRCM